MKVGTVSEIKVHEYRVGLVPSTVLELTKHGHEVFIQSGAGNGVGALDQHYVDAGGKILNSAEEVFAVADMIVKVKEPQANERKLLRQNQILFTYLHLAPDPAQATDLIESGATCIAYETVTDASNHLPLLAPMSQVAGRLSVQAGAAALEKASGGMGLLLGGVPGVAPGKVVIIGGGVVGNHAAQMACGLGADVTIIERSLPRLQQLDDKFQGRAKVVFSNSHNITDAVLNADLVISGVLIPGDSAPKLINREHISHMANGSVIVDVAIDQGGSAETSKATTHSDPTYVVDGVVHYCVANMPGAVARTSTYALGNATLPFILELADKGWMRACRENLHLLDGLNIHDGKVTHMVVATALNQKYHDPHAIIN